MKMGTGGETAGGMRMYLPVQSAECSPSVGDTNKAQFKFHPSMVPAWGNMDDMDDDDNSQL
jgi:hypothetical protein